MAMPVFLVVNLRQYVCGLDSYFVTCKKNLKVKTRSCLFCAIISYFCKDCFLLI